METQSGVPYRRLGRTGEMVSLVGVGGSHIGKPADERLGIAIIRKALDEGINFLDNSWDYYDGASEERMGKALRDGYRQKAFVMTKIDGQTAESATAQLHESLRRLRLETIDLLQFHEIIRPEDPERIFAEGGAFESIVKARDAGKVRYIGFTGHKDPSIHLKMIHTALAHGFTFDTVQMPLNVMDAHFRSFEKHVLPVAVELGIGVLGMKPLASGYIVRSNTVSPVAALQYAMNLPVSVVITGMESMERLEQALYAARTFEPLSEEEIADLLDRTVDAARMGEFEKFKPDTIFDGTVQHPEYLGLAHDKAA